MNIKDNFTDFLKINELRENIVKLIEAKFELTKLNIQEKIEEVAVKAIYAFITFILSIVVVIFLSILIAIGLNQWLNSSWLGYIIILGLYILILTIFIFAKDKVHENIKRKIQQEVDEHINS